MECEQLRTVWVEGERCPVEHASVTAVLEVLAYFDIFHHPLQAEEIVRFARCGAINEGQVKEVLDHLASSGLVRHHAGHWGLDDVERRVVARKHSGVRAQARMPKARTMSRLIARFPFVRAVFISGSLSKGCLAEDGDIDFFVLTTPGRLWVARTLLMLYKKIFLLNSRRDFCVNYLLDTEHLTVEDRNIFTATEVITLLPMFGNGACDAFYAHNAWAFAMFPAANVPRCPDLGIGRARGKVMLERILGGWLGAVLDQWAIKLTWHYWKWKFKGMDPRQFEIALRTRSYVSKHHPRNFQRSVLQAYRERIQQLEQRLGTTMN